MRFLFKLAVLALAAFGVKTLYDKLAPKQQQLRGTGDTFFDRTSNAAREIGSQVSTAAQRVASSAKSGAGDVRDTASREADTVRATASEQADEVTAAAKQAKDEATRTLQDQPTNASSY